MVERKTSDRRRSRSFIERYYDRRASIKFRLSKFIGPTLLVTYLFGMGWLGWLMLFDT